MTGVVNSHPSDNKKPPMSRVARVTMRLLDVLLLLWAVGGFIWLAVLSVDRGLQTTADAAQEKLHTITLVGIPWTAVLLVFGIPFTVAAVRYSYEPFWYSALMAWH